MKKHRVSTAMTYEDTNIWQHILFRVHGQSGMEWFGEHGTTPPIWATSIRGDQMDWEYMVSMERLREVRNGSENRAN